MQQLVPIRKHKIIFGQEDKDMRCIIKERRKHSHSLMNFQRHGNQILKK